MAINHVQFQRGLAMAEFLERYGTQELCHAALVASRWPSGFVCAHCGCSRHSTFLRDGSRYWQCSACREQTTVTSGTVFQATKLPLTCWFLAMHLMTQAKNNVSALELKRHLGVRYKAAWLGASHNATVTGGGAASVKLPQFRAVNTLLGNLKTAFSGTYHSFNFEKYAHRYLGEVQYRFNRRFDLSTILVCLIRDCVDVKAHPERRIRAAELGG